MKNNAIRIFAAALVICAIGALGYMGYQLVDMAVAQAAGNPARAEVVGEAPSDTFEGFESFTVEDPSFAVGVNVYGTVIFKDPKAALASVKVKCKDAISVIRSQAPELGRFRAGNLFGYYDYIWQINWEGVDVGVEKQHIFLSRFLAVYVSGDPHGDE
jgi:hypothetical protein